MKKDQTEEEKIEELKQRVSNKYQELKSDKKKDYLECLVNDYAVLKIEKELKIKEKLDYSNCSSKMEDSDGIDRHFFSTRKSIKNIIEYLKIRKHKNTFCHKENEMSPSLRANAYIKNDIFFAVKEFTKITENVTFSNEEEETSNLFGYLNSFLDLIVELCFYYFKVDIDLKLEEILDLVNKFPNKYKEFISNKSDNPIDQIDFDNICIDSSLFHFVINDKILNAHSPILKVKFEGKNWKELQDKLREFYCRMAKYRYYYEEDKDWFDEMLEDHEETEKETLSIIKILFKEERKIEWNIRNFMVSFGIDENG